MFFSSPTFSNNTLENILEELTNYDIYDFLAKVSVVSLLPNNQNKNNLFAELINGILCKDRDFYKSSKKISYSKFKSIISSLSNLNTAYSVDPNEMPFIEHINFYGNKWIFPGINIDVSYNLQMILNTVCLYDNDFGILFKQKVDCLAGFILDLSTNIANQLGYSFDTINHYETQEIEIPTKRELDRNTKVVKINNDFLKNYTKNYDFKDSLFSEFNGTKIKTIDLNYEYFSKPFLKHPTEDYFIILDPSILSTFTINKIIEISDFYGIKNKLIESLNNNIFKDCLNSLKTMGHKKIRYEDNGIVLINNPDYKEEILNLSNNGILMVRFFCDDGKTFKPFNIDDIYYPNTCKYANRFYVNTKKLTKLKKENAYQIIITSTYSRGMMYTSETKSKNSLVISPYDLKCVSINEFSNKYFIKRFVDSKSKLNSFSPLIQDIDYINLFAENDYSFYIDDDIDYRSCNLIVGFGDTVNYRNKAILSQKIHLAEFPKSQYLKEIKLVDQDRNIYSTISISRDSPNIEYFVEFRNKSIWIVSDIINDGKQIDSYKSLIDMISYWLSELHEYIEKTKLISDILLIRLHLEQEVYFDYNESNNSPLDVSNLINLSIESNIIDLTISNACFYKFSSKTNENEKSFMSILLKNITIEPNILNDKVIEKCFSNPLKKKIFAFDFNNTPYLEPISHKPTMISKIYTDSLCDEIGDYFRLIKKVPIGSIPRDKCSEYCNETVDILYKKLLDYISKYNSEVLLKLLCVDLEAIIYNTMIIQNVYSYNLACYPEKSSKIINDYNMLNASSISLRFLIELISSVQPKGSDTLGYTDYENMISLCYAIITYAYDNDLFFYNVFEKNLCLLKSGRVAFKGPNDDNMVGVSLSTAQNRLDMISNPNTLHFSTSELSKVPKEELDVAFIDEFGYTFEQFSNCIFQMIEFGKTIDSNVKTVETRELVNRISIYLNIESKIISKIIDDISLKKRENYLVPPKPFNKEDVYPWRFNRKLSFSRRPVVMIEDFVIWGNRQLYHMWCFTIDLIEEGKFKAQNKKLKALIGRIANQRGDLFNNKVYEVLSSNKNYIVKKKVSKINKKRISKIDGNDLGDIDILVIDNKKKAIIVCEVKDFSFAKSPYEIHSEYTKLFCDKDNKLCYVSKHKKRVEWIENHIDDIMIEFNLKYGKWKVKDALIVSNEITSNLIYHKDQKIITYAELNNDFSF